MALHDHGRTDRDDTIGIRPQFARPGEDTEVPRYRIPEAEMAPDTAFQIVHDELMLDGNARLNLATFVTTWMEPQARVLMNECAEKNMIDKDEYPVTAEQENRCVRVQQACRDTAQRIAGRLDAMAQFETVSHGDGVPVTAFRLRDGIDKYTVFDGSGEGLRAHGWQVPAYTLPPDLEHVAVLRGVVRNGFSHDLADVLLTDIARVVTRLERGGGMPASERREGFHH
jgi:glutamate/tyrosine decarboxylase-like PLP-dependent enzyme